MTASWDYTFRGDEGAFDCASPRLLSISGSELQSHGLSGVRVGNRLKSRRCRLSIAGCPFGRSTFTVKFRWCHRLLRNDEFSLSRLRLLHSNHLRVHSRPHLLTISAAPPTVRANASPSEASEMCSHFWSIFLQVFAGNDGEAWAVTTPTTACSVRYYCSIFCMDYTPTPVASSRGVRNDTSAQHPGLTDYRSRWCPRCSHRTREAVAALRETEHSRRRRRCRCHYRCFHLH